MHNEQLNRFTAQRYGYEKVLGWRESDSSGLNVPPCITFKCTGRIRNKCTAYIGNKCTGYITLKCTICSGNKCTTCRC